jgi:hypothetical protein
MILTQTDLLDVLHYDPDTGVFRWRRQVSRRSRAGEIAGGSNARGYWVIQIHGRKYKAHRLAWLYMTGAWPAEVVDHRQGVTGSQIDNRWGNLRPLAQAENTQNIRAPYRSNRLGILGVDQLPNGRFRAQIQYGKRRKNLGNFPTAQAAHEAYLQAKAELHPFNTLTH